MKEEKISIIALAVHEVSGINTLRELDQYITKIAKETKELLKKLTKCSEILQLCGELDRYITKITKEKKELHKKLTEFSEILHNCKDATKEHIDTLIRFIIETTNELNEDQKNSNLTPECKFKKEFLSEIIEKTFLLKNNDGNNIFHIIFKENIVITKSLFSKQIPRTCYQSYIFLQKNNEGKTPLDFISGEIELPQELLNQKYDQKYYYDLNNASEPFFHVAIKSSNINIITSLIKKVNIYELDKGGLNALHKISYIKDEAKLEEIINILKDYHLPYITTGNAFPGNTPIILAVSKKNLIAVKKLVQHYSQLIPIYNTFLFQEIGNDIPKEILLFLLNNKNLYRYTLIDSPKYINAYISILKTLKSIISRSDIIDKTKLRALAKSNPILLNTLNHFLSQLSNRSNLKIDKTTLREWIIEYMPEEEIPKFLSPTKDKDSKEPNPPSLSITDIKERTENTKELNIIYKCYILQYLTRLIDYMNYKIQLINNGEYDVTCTKNLLFFAIQEKNILLIRHFIPLLSKNNDSIIHYIDDALEKELFSKEEVRDRLKQKHNSLKRTDKINNIIKLSCSIALLISSSAYIFCTTIKEYESLKPYTIISFIICLSCILTSNLVKSLEEENLSQYFSDNLDTYPSSRLLCKNLSSLDSSIQQSL